MIGKDHHIVIIGGGIAGLTSAWFLLNKGYSNVTILEKRSGTTMEASGLNSGLIRHFHPDAHMRTDLIRSIELISDYQEKADTTFFERSPSLWAFGPEPFLELKNHSHDFLQWRRVSSDDVPEQFVPANDEERIWVTFQRDGLLDSVTLGDHIKQDVADSGATIATNATVEKGQVNEGKWTLKVNGWRDVTADRIINAAGCWANQVGERLGLEPKTFEPVSRHLFQTRTSLVPDSYSYVMDQQNQIFFRRARTGTIVHCCDTNPVEPGAPNEGAEPEEQLQSTVADRYPDLDFDEVSSHWSGQFARTPDRTPIIDIDPDEHTAVWATGLNDYGMTYSLRTGERVLNLLRPRTYLQSM